MIYDENGITVIEYGHGTIMGFQFGNKGEFGYGLASTDPHKIGDPCQNFEDLVGKPATEAGIKVAFSFTKVESLDILLEDLNTIREEMVEYLEAAPPMPENKALSTTSEEERG